MLRQVIYLLYFFRNNSIEMFRFYGSMELDRLISLRRARLLVVLTMVDPFGSVPSLYDSWSFRIFVAWPLESFDSVFNLIRVGRCFVLLLIYADLLVVKL